MNDFRKLEVWKKAMNLSSNFYSISEDFPKSESYGLTSQIRRAFVSIPSNIAEGAGRYSNKEFSHFLSIATGSSFEFECQLELAFRLGYLSSSQFKETLGELKHIQNMLIKLKMSLK